MQAPRLRPTMLPILTTVVSHTDVVTNAQT